MCASQNLSVGSVIGVISIERRDARPPSAIARTPHVSLGRAPVVPLLGPLLT